MKDCFNLKTISHLKELLGVKEVEIIKDFSENLVCEDKKEIFIPGDWESSSECRVVPDKRVDTPFYRINKICIVHGEDKVSLISYKAFAVSGNDLTFINEETNYIFEDMDAHIFKNIRTYGYWYWERKDVRELDVFLKENTLYGITYLDGKLHKIDIKGKAVPEIISNGTFLSIEGNTVYENTVVTGKKDKYGEYREYVDYMGVKTKVLHKDKKEIEDIEILDIAYGNDGWVTDAPDFSMAAIISFVDGTKRLLLETKNGKKSTSAYFKDLKLYQAFISLSEKEFEKELPENKQSYSEVADSDIYNIPGLTFDCTTDSLKGEFIVKNNGNMKILK